MAVGKTRMDATKLVLCAEQVGARVGIGAGYKLTHTGTLWGGHAGTGCACACQDTREQGNSSSECHATTICHRFLSCC